MRKTSLNTGRRWCLALVLAIQAALVGCGGGDAEDQALADSTRQPVNCVAAPEACQ